MNNEPSDVCVSEDVISYDAPPGSGLQILI
jgi:hypothetical protein